MKRLLFSTTFILMLCFTIMSDICNAQNNFVGAERCSFCHNGKELGSQYQKWQATKHSQSYKAAGVAGKPECERCHAPVAAFKFEGVTCETCHNAGGNYKSVMKDRGKAKQAGLILPNEKVCLACHDITKVPVGHKPFKFDFVNYFKSVEHKMPSN